MNAPARALPRVPAPAPVVELPPAPLNGRHEPPSPAPPPPPLSWWDRVLAQRDRLVASPRFQRWASAFPLTRPVALSRARRLFDVCAGFVYTQTLLASLRLGLFELLAEGPLTPAEVALRTGIEPDAARRLLEAGAAIGLTEPRGRGRFGLGPLGAPVVGNAALTAMIEHNALFYDDLRDPVALLRGDGGPTHLANYWGYAGGGPPAVREDTAGAYSALMAASVPLVAEELLDAYGLHGHHTLLDIGGGEGAFVEAAALRYPDLRFLLVDLPPVARRAEERFARAGLEGRAVATGGDFRRDPLPRGADVVTMLRVLHDHDDPVVLALLRSVRSALEPGATLVIAEPVSGMRGAEPVGDAYFALYFLAMGSGRTRSPETYHRMLREAGFRSSRLLRPRRPVQAAVIVATA